MRDVVSTKHGAFGCVTILELKGRGRVAVKTFFFEKTREMATIKLPITMNNTYDNEDSELCNNCARRIDFPSVNKTGESLESFTVEITALKELKEHENVVKLLWWRLDATQAFIVLEAAEMDFYDHLAERETVLSQEEIFKFTSQLSRALHHIHSMGFVHGDVKLENMLLFPDDVVKLSDFGACCAPKNASFGRGSLSYLPPEAFIKGADKDLERADIWALGVCMFAMKKKRFPFTSTMASDVLFQRFLKAYRAGFSFQEIYEFATEDTALASLMEEMLDIRHEHRPSSSALVSFFASR